MAAKTYFCYGVPVTNESLTYATMAYPELEGPFRFIRLVQKRIREGTLQTAQRSAVASLPIELWDLVRHKVTDVELYAAEREFLKRHACSHCIKPHGCGCCGAVPSTEWANLLLCESCNENMIQHDGFGDPKLVEKCRILLQDYGLDMPSTRTLRCSELDNWPWVPTDPASVAFIAVSPTSPTNSLDADSHVSCKQLDVDDGDSYRNDGIWPISLDKPADADQRFRHLLRDLHLTPLKVSDGTIGIARATDPTRKRTYEKVRADEVKPQWHLFTTVECDWY